MASPMKRHISGTAGPGILPDLEYSALLLVDLQKAFIEPGRGTSVRGPLSVLMRSLLLAAAFRAAGHQVFATRHVHRVPPPPGGMGSWWGSFLTADDPSSELVAPVLCLPDVRLVEKHHYSAFRETGLEKALRDIGVRTVVICGVMTHICVDTTARDAFQSGFDVVVVRDACSSSRPSLHRSSLACISHAVARVPSTSDLLSSAGLRRADG
jgi:bifunctional isochorismate lyase/aryl carrier protein